MYLNPTIRLDSDFAFRITSVYAFNHEFEPVSHFLSADTSAYIEFAQKNITNNTVQPETLKNICDLTLNILFLYQRSNKANLTIYPFMNLL